jgi:hypothetical protein
MCSRRAAGPDDVGTVIETHPESTDDLRLVDPFPELRSLVDAYEIDRADTHAYSHIPFVVILRRALDKWEAQVSFIRSIILPQSLPIRAHASGS